MCKTCKTCVWNVPTASTNTGMHVLKRIKGLEPLFHKIMDEKLLKWWMHDLHGKCYPLNENAVKKTCKTCLLCSDWISALELHFKSFETKWWMHDLHGKCYPLNKNAVKKTCKTCLLCSDWINAL